MSCSAALTLYETPVTFMPGRARLRAMPNPTGSPTPPHTIGMVLVSSMSAFVRTALKVTRTSGRARTSSAAASAMLAVAHGADFVTPSFAKRTTSRTSRPRAASAATMSSPGLPTER